MASDICTHPFEVRETFSVQGKTFDSRQEAEEFVSRQKKLDELEAFVKKSGYRPGQMNHLQRPDEAEFRRIAAWLHGNPSVLDEIKALLSSSTETAR